MNFYTYCSVVIISFLSLAEIPSSQSQEIFPKNKYWYWRTGDQFGSFSHRSSAIQPLSPSKQKLVNGKPKKLFASSTLSGSTASTSVSPTTGTVPDEVNKLVDKASSASVSQPSHHPKIKPSKGGPPHYPPINRKALYASGLIYLRDFRPGSPLY